MWSSESVNRDHTGVEKGHAQGEVLVTFKQKELSASAFFRGNAPETNSVEGFPDDLTGGIVVEGVASIVTAAAKHTVPDREDLEPVVCLPAVVKTLEESYSHAGWTEVFALFQKFQRSSEVVLQCR